MSLFDIFSLIPIRSKAYIDIVQQIRTVQWHIFENVGLFLGNVHRYSQLAVSDKINTLCASAFILLLNIWFLCRFPSWKASFGFPPTMPDGLKARSWVRPVVRQRRLPSPSKSSHASFPPTLRGSSTQGYPSRTYFPSQSLTTQISSPTCWTSTTCMTPQCLTPYASATSTTSSIRRPAALVAVCSRPPSPSPMADRIGARARRLVCTGSYHGILP